MNLQIFISKHHIYAAFCSSILDISGTHFVHLLSHLATSSLGYCHWPVLLLGANWSLALGMLDPPLTTVTQPGQGFWLLPPLRDLNENILDVHSIVSMQTLVAFWYNLDMLKGLLPCKIWEGSGQKNSLSFVLPIDCSKMGLLLTAHLETLLHAKWMYLHIGLLCLLGMSWNGNQTGNASLYISDIFPCPTYLQSSVLPP